MVSGSDGGLQSLYSELVRWILIDGNRLGMTAGVTTGFFLVTWWLVAAGVLAVGPRSPITSVLGSGVVAGLFSLISVTLAINQLISSRVFGSLDRLQEKLDGGTAIRDTVAEAADHPSPPVRTAEFIAFVGETIGKYADGLRDDYAPRDDEIGEQLSSYVDDLTGYADRVGEVSSEMPAERVIAVLAGPDFAEYLDRTDELRSARAERLTADERDALDTIAELLGTIAVFRQYYKTIALHQELAQLSRQFVFVAFPAIAVAILAPLLFRTNPTAVGTALPLAPVMSAILAIVLAPLVLVMAYMLRIATIFRYTVSVAPFVPPVEWPWTDDYP